MNCLPARISADGTSVDFGDAGSLPVPGDLRDRPEPGRSVVVGVRPESFEVVPTGSLRATVLAVEWLGHECLLSAEVGGERFTVRQAGMAGNEVGSTVDLQVPSSGVHLFDPATTERIA